MGGLVRGGAWRREVIRDGRGRGGGLSGQNNAVLATFCINGSHVRHQ